MFDTIFVNMQWNMNYKTIAYILVIIIALLFLRKKSAPAMKKRPSKHGILGYTIIYTDQKTDDKKENVVYGTILHAKKYDIQGKPDYIFQRFLGRSLVPVEIKSGQIKDSTMPHKGDLLQLAAYFLIVAEVYGRKPKYGRLVYKDYMFIVKNTAKLRKEVLKTVSGMRRMLKDGQGHVNPSFVTCRYCICNKTVCQYCESPKKSVKDGIV